MATRWIAILIFTLAGLPRLGVAPAQTDHCGMAECRPAVVRVTCCGETVVEACPANGGECHCGLSSAPDQDDRPQAPPPRTERLPLVALDLSAPRVVWRASDVQPPHVSQVGQGRYAALTHNEIQALLGIWRT